MEEKKTLTNKGKSVIFSVLAVVLYAIPLVVMAIINKDKLFKNAETSLTFLSVGLIIAFVLFAKKVVKKICNITTIGVFGSLVVLIVSLALKNFLDEIYLISLTSLIGALIAWYPTQISRVYNKYALTDDGKPRNDITFKQANKLLFGFFI